MRGWSGGIARSDALLLLAAAVVSLSLVLAMAAGRPGDLDDRARSIETQLRCPTCQGLSIADSPATSATQMRSLVREQLASGATDDEIRAFFVARYGRWILLDPPANGPDLTLWLAPAVIVAAGAALVVRRSLGRGPRAASGTWSAARPLPVPRLGTVAIASAMVVALVVPITAAVGPRLVAQQASGETPRSVPSIEELEASVRARPGDAESLVALGDALLGANRGGEAADRYKAALELDPNDVGALLGIGTILLGAGRPDAAGPVFDRILALAPDEPDALLYRAVARLQVDGSATDEVRRDVERFLEAAPAGDPRRAMAAGLLATSPPATSTPSGQSRPEPASP